jgi:hypothetical protein
VGLLWASSMLTNAAVLLVVFLGVRAFGLLRRERVDAAAATGHGGQQGGGAQVVVAHVVDHVAELPAQANHGRRMADRVHAVQGAVQNAGDPRVGQVGVDVLDVVAQVGGPAGVGPWMEAVERADLVADIGQEVDDVAADEAGPAGDQDAHGRSG